MSNLKEEIKPYTKFLKQTGKKLMELTPDEKRTYERLRRQHSEKLKAFNNRPDQVQKRIDYRKKYKESGMLKDQSKSWRESNPGAAAAYMKEYNKRESVKAHRKELLRIRYETDENYRQRIDLRGWLGNQYKRLRRRKNKHGDKWLDLLGCTMKQFIEHIESQFEDGMTWRNWGNGELDWNVDHIIPLNTFDLSDPEQLMIAANYKNLRPLWRVVNVRRPRDGGDILALSQCQDIN